MVGDAMPDALLHCGLGPLPHEVSNHPDAPTWIPVLVAGIDFDHRWYVRCPDCGRPNTHSSAVGFRVSHCHCEGMRYKRDVDGYIMAPPGATLAPYPDRCKECGPARAYIYTPVGLEAGRLGRGLVADYVCDQLHRWSRPWRDSPSGPPASELQDPRAIAARPPADTRRCALYRHFDENGILLYVGISENPITRGKTHAIESMWVQFATRMEAEWLNNRVTAGAAERSAIQTERPIFNRAHAGDDVEARVRRYLNSRAEF